MPPPALSRRAGRPATASLVLALAVAVGAAGCRGASDGAGPVSSDALQLVEVASDLTNPLYLTAPHSDGRLFIVEQPGRIRIVKGSTLLAEPFLDITAKVLSGGERGLLSVAFHPRYASTGYFYVDYTDLAGNTRVERYTVSSANPDVADPASARLILGVDQPYANHNGGLLLFGPDGMLYVGMGDGGGQDDPHGNGQSKSTLLGKLLRLDVDAVPATDASYSVPPDNPFVGDPTARGEIWALGLRNPWRFAFDRVAGLLYVADVGQREWEEVSVVPANRAGVNFGWSVFEGNECFAGGPCNPQGLDGPVLQYSHADGCSITGGFVYRGGRMPDLTGHYFYSDYCSGFLRSFRYINGQPTDQRSWNVASVGSVLSFGEDAVGDLYVLSGSGRVYRLDAR